MTAKDIIKHLQLEPLPMEGGFFRQTYRSAELMPTDAGPRRRYTCIYYLITPTTFSSLHMLPHDEIFHFYLGDPVSMLQLHADGSGSVLQLGQDMSQDQLVQTMVPKHTWQGTRLVDGGAFALLGTTMSPGFDYDDFIAPDEDALLKEYPDFAREINSLMFHATN